jgi:hypothetical protein
MHTLSRNFLIVSILLFLPFFLISSTEKIFADTKKISNLEKKAQQINAFQNFDTNKAYSFASPFIKSKFSNADKFGSMVKSAYPMIWEPKEFKFLEFTLFNESLIQRVLFIDKNERIFMFDYEIKNYGQDEWLINGVYQVKKTSSGA